MIHYETMLKTIFWEYNFSIDDIKLMANGQNLQKKKFLFVKILLNSVNLLSDLKIFKRDDLKYLVENFRISEFNASYAQRRKNIVECYFFDKPLTITELQWIA
jgi:lipoate-protein ligase A